jgi:antitoxin ParD1/3/4
MRVVFAVLCTSRHGNHSTRLPIFANNSIIMNCGITAMTSSAIPRLVADHKEPTMPTQNVNLSAQLAKFVKQRVKSGRYQNASEVVRAGLRLLERHEAVENEKLRTLKRLSQESFAALDRGEYTTVTPETLDQFFENISRKTGRR